LAVFAVLAGVALLLGGCSEVSKLVRDAASRAEEAGAGEAGSRVESVLEDVTRRVSGVADRYHTTLKGDTTSFTVTASDAADSYALVVKDLYFTTTDGIELVVEPADGEAASVTVECPEDMLDYGLRAGIEDGVITVSCDRERAFTCGGFRITVKGTCGDIYVGTGMDVDIDAAGAEKFSFRVDGAASGDITSLDAGDAKLEINGAANLKLSGRAGDFSAVINGAGELDAEELACDSADVTVNGAASVVIAVDGKLDAVLRGAGSIKYIGDPEVTQEISGLGTIEKAKTDE